MKKYIVLNGDLGATAYIYKQLEKKYASIGISVVISKEPSSAEVRGLVMDRKQGLFTGVATLTSRVYGHQISHLVRTKNILISL
jgi:hypothetical protein